jgi:hypothetical protein
MLETAAMNAENKKNEVPTIFKHARFIAAGHRVAGKTHGPGGEPPREPVGTVRPSLRCRLPAGTAVSPE